MSHNRPPVPSEEQIEAERQILELRRAGISFHEISRQLDMPRSTVRSRFKSGLARVVREPAHEVRQLEEDRLDRLQAAVWSKALRGDLGAVDRVLRVMSRRAEMLGLDHSHGVAERALALEADRVRLVALAFGRAVDEAGLSDTQKELMVRSFLDQLRVVAVAEEAPQ